MKITKITQSTYKDDRAVIHLDSGKVFSVHKDLMLDNQLWVGKELTQEILSKLEQEDVYYRLLDKAYAKLARRLCSEKELLQYLNKYIYSNKLEVKSSVVENIQVKLKGMGLIDDLKFAMQFVALRANRKSENELKNLLRQKGIASELIEQVFISNDDDTELQTLEILAVKKLKNLKGRNLEDKEIRTKLLSFLYRKGFPFESSKQVVNKLIS